MKNRKEYIDSMAAKLKEWDDDLDRFEGRVGHLKDTAAESVKDGYRRTITDLRGKSTALKERVHAVGEETGDAFEKVREGLEQGWHDLKKGFSDAKDAFGHHAPDRKDGDV